MISVAVTPGSSAANAGLLNSTSRTARLFHFGNIGILPDAHSFGAPFDFVSNGSQGVTPREIERTRKASMAKRVNRCGSSIGRFIS
ncbi:MULTISPECIES: hypothetical protein [unclassified Bradyrhizobium]|uniref:hypothetical protein n=1 Tax=unclassified Bradyrhizobium TaxID=2631580 RepID=UPI0015C92427|nr:MULTISPECIES: hypothetical protein [unclassified Bradyrhizobium]NYG43546.1 hypothetical protein [Bradyrhizobium sp. IAR9]